jgi:hypothetical protein
MTNFPFRYELEAAYADFKRRSGKPILETEIRNEFWSYGEFELVGHGKQTNDKCGTFNKFMGCLNVEAHNTARWLNPDLKKDSVFVKSVYHSCDKPTCPKCFKFGWAVRQATRMEEHLKKASASYGLVEHIVASVPVELYGLSLEALRARAVKILANRAIPSIFFSSLASIIFIALRQRTVSLKSNFSRRLSTMLGSALSDKK